MLICGGISITVGCNSFGNSEFGAAAARIPLYLFRRRSYYLTADQLQSCSMIAHALRYGRGAHTGPRGFLHELFNDPVFQRVIGDNHESAVETQEVDSLF